MVGKRTFGWTMGLLLLVMAAPRIGQIARQLDLDSRLRGALKAHNLEEIERLVVSGADPNQSVHLYGTTSVSPLGVAAGFNDARLVELLLRRGARVDL